MAAAPHVCTYELYAATYKAARGALRASDEGLLRALRAKAESRRGGARSAALLALADAQAHAAKRSKAEVCRPHCDTRCERGV